MHNINVYQRTLLFEINRKTSSNSDMDEFIDMHIWIIIFEYEICSFIIRSHEDFLVSLCSLYHFVFMQFMQLTESLQCNSSYKTTTLFYHYIRIKFKSNIQYSDTYTHTRIPIICHSNIHGYIYVIWIWMHFIHNLRISNLVSILIWSFGYWVFDMLFVDCSLIPHIRNPKENHICPGNHLIPKIQKPKTYLKSREENGRWREW